MHWRNAADAGSGVRQAETITRIVRKASLVQVDEAATAAAVQAVRLADHHRATRTRGLLPRDVVGIGRQRGTSADREEQNE